jgi:hypothetical protein
VRRRELVLSLNRHMLSTLAVSVLLAPSPAPAQTVAHSFEELAQVLKKGRTVVVTEASGHRTKGTVVDVSKSSLLVFVPEARTFAEGTVTEIRGPDTLRNGALTGLGVGAGAGLVMVAAMCADGPDCGPSVQVVSVAAGIGAAIGAGIDALLNNRGKVLYRLSRQQTFSLTISPLAGKDRQGVLASVRF